MNSSQVFDKYSESVGHLVMTEDGAVTNVSWFSDVTAVSFGGRWDVFIQIQFNIETHDSAIAMAYVCIEAPNYIYTVRPCSEIIWLVFLSKFHMYYTHSY